MGLKLLEVQEDDEFEELFRVFRAGFTNPGTRLWPLFTGDWTSDPAQREAALEESTHRFKSWHRADPTSHWLKVLEDSTGEVLGGGRWSLYETGNPYDGHGKLEASWWPEGKPRELATICLNQFLATSAKLMNKPHACKCLSTLRIPPTGSIAFDNRGSSLEHPVHASGTSQKGRRHAHH